MDSNLTHRCESPHSREGESAMKLSDVPDFPDDTLQEDCEAGYQDNVGGFVELFCLWCATYQAGTTSMPGFELSSTRLVASAEHDRGAAQNPSDTPIPSRRIS
jgi:hypothetical protein